MSSAYNLPDYRAQYFDYKDLDKIRGQPTIDTIVKLLWQVRHNSQRVSTTLGGGGQLRPCFVIPQTAYNNIPNFIQKNLFVYIYIVT